MLLLGVIYKNTIFISGAELMLAKQPRPTDPKLHLWQVLAIALRKVLGLSWERHSFPHVATSQRTQFGMDAVQPSIFICIGANSCLPLIFLTQLRSSSCVLMSGGRGRSRCLPPCLAGSGSIHSRGKRHWIGLTNWRVIIITHPFRYNFGQFVPSSHCLP